MKKVTMRWWGRRTLRELEYRGGNVLQAWCDSGGNWNNPVTFACLVYWWASCFLILITDWQQRKHCLLLYEGNKCIFELKTEELPKNLYVHSADTVTVHFVQCWDSLHECSYSKFWRRVFVCFTPMNWKSCLRWSSSLWHPATTVSPQHSRTSGRRLIATRSRDFSVTRPPLAASQTERRVQAVYDGTSLLVRRRTILYGGPDPDFLDRYAFLQFILTDVFSWLTAVCRQSRRYTWSSLNVTQMCHLWLKKFENS